MRSHGGLFGGLAAALIVVVVMALASGGLPGNVGLRPLNKAQMIGVIVMAVGILALLSGALIERKKDADVRSWGFRLRFLALCLTAGGAMTLFLAA